MRTCVRCGSKMKEGCIVKVKGKEQGLVAYGDTVRVYMARLGDIKAAVCPKCGEVSLYIDDTSVFK